MEKLIECVPNFSEGRNMSVINQIADEIKGTEGAYLLDIDPGKDTNRTVITFVANPHAVVEAAFKAIKKASELIDMSKHKGAHPRIGATDVCPFIPVANITDEECIELSKKLAKRVAEELKIPTFLYAKAATRPDRVNLPDIRKGEYEGLAEKLKSPDFKPDYGSAVFNAKSGATVFGVRDFMLAYNINLNTRDTSLAKEIGMNIRESGRVKKDKSGNTIKDATGNSVKLPGKLKFCQATGWFIEEYGYAQVTMNLHNYKVTGLHTAFDEVCKEATKLGLRVTGSELIGLAPKQAIIDTGIHYLKKQGKNTGITEKEIIKIAMLSLGLSDTNPFKPEEKIIEYKIQKNKAKLANMSLIQFSEELSSDSPAPGGGSVAALCGSLSSALIAMVANLTYGKKNYVRHNKIMESTSIKAQILMPQFNSLIDKDTDAFNAFMNASKLPKATEEEKKMREKALEEAAKLATEIPLETLTLAREAAVISEIVARKGNNNALSDAGVAAILSESAAEGAYFNVKINLPTVKDNNFKERVLKEANTHLQEVKKIKRRVVNFVHLKLK